MNHPEQVLQLNIKICSFTLLQINILSCSGMFFSSLRESSPANYLLNSSTTNASTYSTISSLLHSF